MEAKNSYKKLLENEGLVDYTVIPNIDHELTLEQLGIIGKWYDDVAATLEKHYGVPKAVPKPKD